METMHGTDTNPRQPNPLPAEPFGGEQNEHNAQLEARGQDDAQPTLKKAPSGAIWLWCWTRLPLC